MYNPESQLDDLIQNDNHDLQINPKTNGIGNEISGNLTIGNFDKGESYNSIGYNNKNLIVNGSNYGQNELNGIDEAYKLNEQQYKDSSIQLENPNLDSTNIFRTGQSHFGTQEFYKKDEGSINSYGSSNGYDSAIFDKIHFADFGGALARVGENDTSLPIANIGRLMKSVLPNSAKIAKQAKDMIRDCVTEFIFFISSEASDLCNMERRKTLNADDIFIAMNKLGFEHYDKPLKMYHSKWRENRDQNIAQNNQRSH